MFTGIVKETGIIEKVQYVNSGIELVVRISYQLGSTLKLKSNLALDGQVFTVLKKKDDEDSCLLYFYLSHPRKLEIYRGKKKINLETAIRAGEEIPGSLFSGIPSGTAQVLALTQISSDKWLLEVYWETFLLNYLDIKDRVCIDGVLLRIKQIVGSSIFFELYGDTLKLTNLEKRKKGDSINIEVDPMVKKIAQIFEKLKNKGGGQ